MPWLPVQPDMVLTFLVSALSRVDQLAKSPSQLVSELFALRAEDAASSLSWRQSVYAALMRSSLAALRNLDLHYHVAKPPNDAQQEGGGQSNDLADSSVSDKLPIFQPLLRAFAK